MGVEESKNELIDGYEVMGEDKEKHVLHLISRQDAGWYFYRRINFETLPEAQKAEARVRLSREKTTGLLRVIDTKIAQSEGTCSTLHKLDFLCESAKRSLASQIKSRRLKAAPYSEEELRLALQTVGEGVRFLRSRGVVHNAIRLETVLLRDQEYCVIDPFLSGEESNLDRVLAKKEGFPAPQELSPTVKMTTALQAKSSLYSFGMCLLSMGLLESVTDLYNDGRLNQKELADKLHIFNSKHSKELSQQLSDILAQDAYLRPSWEDLKPINGPVSPNSFSPFQSETPRFPPTFPQAVQRPVFPREQTYLSRPQTSYQSQPSLQSQPPLQSQPSFIQQSQSSFVSQPSFQPQPTFVSQPSFQPQPALQQPSFQPQPSFLPQPSLQSQPYYQPQYLRPISPTRQIRYQKPQPLPVQQTRQIRYAKPEPQFRTQLAQQMRFVKPVEPNHQYVPLPAPQPQQYRPIEINQIPTSQQWISTESHHHPYTERTSHRQNAQSWQPIQTMTVQNSLQPINSLKKVNTPSTAQIISPRSGAHVRASPQRLVGPGYPQVKTRVQVNVRPASGQPRRIERSVIIQNPFRQQARRQSRQPIPAQGEQRQTARLGSTRVQTFSPTPTPIKMTSSVSSDLAASLVGGSRVSAKADPHQAR